MADPLRCPCGRVLSPGEISGVCPACGAPAGAPDRGPSLEIWAPRACLILGLLAIVLWAASFTELTNRLLPRSISRAAEERRVSVGYLISMGSALAALLAGSVRPRSGALVRTLGLVCASAPLLLLLIQGVNYIANFPTFARRAQCTNNLKQIALGLMTYESAHHALPPRAIRDAHGRPLLSWRVAILPYIGQGPLFEKFHLDEPWDGPHNAALVDQIPPVYNCPSQAGWSRTLTLYQALDGPGTLLDPAEPGRIGARPGETLAVVEGPSPVPWTSPREVAYRPGSPFPPWEVTHPGGFNAAFADGSVKFLSTSMPEADLKAAATKREE